MSGNRSDPLSRIESAQQRSLERLRHDGPDRALLVELLEASCLLELAKVDTTRLDVATYLQLVVDLVAQMYPVDGCAATVTLADTRIVAVHAGRRPDPGTPYPLVVGESSIGVLVAGAAQPGLDGAARFFERAAEQVARDVSGVIEAERLRREAATATAARIASEVDEDDLVDDLEALALALASFPGVIGSELVVDHEAVGPPLHLHAGYWDDDGAPHSIESVTLDLARVGCLVARLRSSGSDRLDDFSLREVLAGLAGSLDRLGSTRRLRLEAQTDELSGLGNRRQLEHAFGRVLARADRYRELVAVLLVDLDRFKSVNDVLGHDVGDDVIRACAAALRARTRAYDECVRLGGDEFVVLAPVPDVLDAVELARDLRETIRERAGAVLPAAWELTASVGVALFPDSAHGPEALLRAADDALYRAKGAGAAGDGIAVASPVSPEDVSDRAAGGPDARDGTKRASRARRFLRRSARG